VAQRGRLVGLVGVVVAAVVAVVGLAPGAGAGGRGPVVLDDFASASAWEALPAVGVGMTISAEDVPGRGRALRIDYDFSKGAGYAVARRRIDLPLPANYRFSYTLRGTGPKNTLEFKLVDPSGDNVWWVNQRDIRFPAEFTPVRHKRRHVSKAWGPNPEHPAEARFLEFAVTATGGGVGTVWIADLKFEELDVDVPFDAEPRVSVSSSAGDAAPTVLGVDGQLAWLSAPSDATPTVTVDFTRSREFGGLTVVFAPGSRPAAYAVEVSDDGSTWTGAAKVEGGGAGANSDGRDDVRLPESEARFLRVRTVAAGKGPVGIARLIVRPLSFGETDSTMLRVVAGEEPRGRWPRGLLDEATYWTITGAGVGVRGGTAAALVGEDGTVEVGVRTPMVEPIVVERVGGGIRALTWADGPAQQTLEDGHLPIPRVVRTFEGAGAGLTLETVVVPTDSTARGVLVRHTLVNRGASARSGKLVVAVRPVQVNPWYQFLNNPGGAAEVHRIDGREPGVLDAGSAVVESITPVDGQGVSTFEGGEIGGRVALGVWPTERVVEDPRGMASGALWYGFELAPGASRLVDVRVRPGEPDGSTDGGSGLWSGVPAIGAEDFERGFAEAKASWLKALEGVVMELPGADGRRVADSIRANLAYILLNRDGAGIQPGSRAYRRTWIRDGSMTAAAMLSLGREAEVRAFLEWFAPFQYDNGKVPCCVDRRGPDPVPEHDSHGQFVFLVRSLVEHTGDLELAERMMPRVARAVDYIEFLRAQRLTAEYAGAEGLKKAKHGLVTESISHEGYSAKPMHSYWDCFFVLKGLDDAAWLARTLGRSEDLARYERLRGEFAASFAASIRVATTTHGIDYVPGCVELGDFDATSTTIAMFPCGGERVIPEGMLGRTFERAWESFVARRDGKPWENYTPYELRTVGAMVRLGERDRAWAMLDWFFKDQLPNGWHSWAEVVWSDRRRAAFIGDMPHTWVGSDFINAAVGMLAYERSSGELVLMGGVPRAWLESEEGVRVEGLRVGAREVSVVSRRLDDGRVRIEVSVKPAAGTERVVQPQRVVLDLPELERLSRVTVDGKPVKRSPGSAVELGDGGGVVEFGWE
jgi:hypothetical protein